jgi:hypothetical protein
MVKGVNKMFGRKKQVSDILTENINKMNKLKTQADLAVGIVTSTISGLELINQEIDDTIDDINNYVTQLNETRNAMSKNRKYNTAIIANFTKLLEVDEDMEG